MQQVIKTAYRHAGHAEHLGFVLIAYCDVLEIHRLVYVVTVWLAITGVPAFIKDCRSC